MKTSRRVHVSDNERTRLEELVRNGNTPQKVALRARIVLLSAEGVSTRGDYGATGHDDANDYPVAESV